MGICASVKSTQVKSSTSNTKKQSLCKATEEIFPVEYKVEKEVEEELREEENDHAEETTVDHANNNVARKTSTTNWQDLDTDSVPVKAHNGGDQIKEDENGRLEESNFDDNKEHTDNLKENSQHLETVTRPEEEEEKTNLEENEEKNFNIETAHHSPESENEISKAEKLIGVIDEKDQHDDKTEKDEEQVIVEETEPSNALHEGEGKTNRAMLYHPYHMM